MQTNKVPSSHNWRPWKYSNNGQNQLVYLHWAISAVQTLDKQLLLYHKRLTGNYCLTLLLYKAYDLKRKRSSLCYMCIGDLSSYVLDRRCCRICATVSDVSQCMLVADTQKTSKQLGVCR